MTKTMKKIITQGPGEPLVVAEGPLPKPRKKQLLLRVKACGVCGSDLHWVQLGLSGPGTVLGHEFSGEVVDVGDGASEDWKPGDRAIAYPFMTCGQCPACLTGELKRCPHAKALGLGNQDADGAYAEYVVVNADASVKIPDTVSWEEAACIEPFSVGLYALRRANILPGQNILVVGAGPIGLSVVSWSRFCGAGSVVVSERSAHRMTLALKMGADTVIDASTEKDVTAAFVRETGTKPDLLVEAVGTPGMIQHCIKIAPPGCRILVVGACMEKDTILPGMALSKDLELIFICGYDLSDFKLVMKMVGQERIKPGMLITHRVSLDGLPAAFEALKTPTDQCKVMILP